MCSVLFHIVITVVKRFCRILNRDNFNICSADLRKHTIALAECRDTLKYGTS